MLELKLIANNMAVSIMSEMIRNEDKRKENETEGEIRFRTCIFKKYKSNKSNIYNNTNSTSNLTNNRTFRYMWRFQQKIWKRKSISKKVLRSSNRNRNKHRTYSNEDTNTLRKIINDILMIHKNVENVKF